jgi:branched-chain amino acid aminotransferase
VPWIDVIPKEVQDRGAHLWIASTPRVPDASVDPTIKNYQWSDLTSGLLEAHDHGYDSAILCDAQDLSRRDQGSTFSWSRTAAFLRPIAAACTESRASPYSNYVR